MLLNKIIILLISGHNFLFYLNGACVFYLLLIIFINIWLCSISYIDFVFVMLFICCFVRFACLFFVFYHIFYVVFHFCVIKLSSDDTIGKFKI